MQELVLVCVGSAYDGAMLSIPIILFTWWGPIYFLHASSTSQSSSSSLPPNPVHWDWRTARCLACILYAHFPLGRFACVGPATQRFSWPTGVASRPTRDRQAIERRQFFGIGHWCPPQLSWTYDSNSAWHIVPTQTHTGYLLYTNHGEGYNPWASLGGQVLFIYIAWTC